MTTKPLDLPELIEWHEGMLLVPQHFQQLTARAEVLTQFMFAQSSVFPWGVIDLKIDQAALNGRILRVLNVEAIMPDGLLALGGSERGLKLEFDLQKIDADKVRICLAVPRESDLYNLSDNSRYQAFARKDELTPDGVSEADPATIPRIRPRLRLDTEQSNLAGLTVLPLIEFNAQGTVLDQTEYIPPLLTVKAGQPLASLCARVGRAVREMATNLAHKLGKSDNKNDPAAVQQLQWLVSGLPLFEALLKSESHPYFLYLALCSIAGSVAFLSESKDGIPPDFPAYKHDDLLVSFREVVNFIQLALSEGLKESWISKDFSDVSDTQKTVEEGGEPGERPSERTYEIGPVLEDAFGKDEADFSATYFGLMLRLPPSLLPDSMTDWGESCLLAQEDAIADLELSRSKGAICERVDFLEDLVVAPGSVLFRVLNNPKWINPKKKLVLKSAKQETRHPDKVTLFVKKRSEPKRSVMSRIKGSMR